MAFLGASLEQSRVGLRPAFFSPYVDLVCTVPVAAVRPCSCHALSCLALWFHRSTFRDGIAPVVFAGHTSRTTEMI